MKISPRDYDVTIRWSEADQVFLASVAELTRYHGRWAEPR